MEDVSPPSSATTEHVYAFTDNSGVLSTCSKSTGLKSDQEQEREVAAENWDDHRSYMRIKKRKLDEQFRGMDNSKKSTIFEGVTIYVNGWTQPNADELKHMIHEHGGMYEFNLYSNTKVTHTIATNLPNSKVKNLGNSIVCSPNWIVDSIAAGYRLPVESYRLYSNWTKGQKVLKVSEMSPLQKSKLDIGSHSNSSASNCVLSPTDRHFNSKAGVLPTVTALPSTNEQDTLEKMKESHSFSIKTIMQPTKALQPNRKLLPSKSSEDKVNEFFKHSRLHYLSTWSTEMKQFTAKMHTKIHAKYSKLPANVSLRSQQSRAVVHIDLDCFFVSVSIQSQPQLRGKPVAVTHAKAPSLIGTKRASLESEGVQSLTSSSSAGPSSSTSRIFPDSTSDIASCSYEARKYGIRNGMSVGTALKLCPNLILLSYDFDGYRKVSQIFYETLLMYSSVVEAVSCDEAYIEFTDFASSFEQVEKIVKELRTEVEHKTGCTVSAGIACNMLLARLSTRVAKPNGQFYLSNAKIDDFLASQKVCDLPGVGYSMTQKLSKMLIENCNDLQKIPLVDLQSYFGAKTGKMLYNYCRGTDTRDLKLQSERKSVSVDMNFGIRFTEISEAESLIQSLALELERRAEVADVLGETVTLKLKTRRQDAPHETWKYLGHGSCDNVTRSVTFFEPTRDASEISRLALNLMYHIKPSVCDIRGVGLQLSKLVHVDDSSSFHNRCTDIRKIFRSAGPSAVTRSVMLESSEPSLSPVSVSRRKHSSTLYSEKAIPLTHADATCASYGAVERIRCNVEAVQDMSLESKQGRSSQEQEHTVLIEDDVEYLKRLHRYISDWITNSLDGPIDGDVGTFTAFLSSFLQSNLEVVSVTLKYIRKTILQLQVTKWYNSFDLMLNNIQNKVKILYSGKLVIDSIE